MSVEDARGSARGDLPDTANALGTFLRVRRQQVRPGQVGLRDAPSRRVPGLRREELALLAGVSGSYYVRLEQGRAKNPSDQVIDALAAALGLEEESHRHLRALARPPARKRRAARAERVRAEVRRLVHRQVGPAVLLGRHLDVLEANPLAEALHVSLRCGRNIVRDAFLDGEAVATYAPGELGRIRANGVAALRAAAGIDVDDPRLAELVGELSLCDQTFRRLWNLHDIRRKSSDRKTFRHPLVGDVELGVEPLAVAGDARQSIVCYHADPGSVAEQRLDLLASLIAAPSEAPALISAQRVTDA